MQTTFEYGETSQTCRISDGKMILDPDNNQAVITATNAAICSYRLDDLSAIAVSRMINLNRFIKYNDRYYTTYDDYFESLPAADTNATVAQTRILPFSGKESFVADPLMVNENFYAATNAGNIWSKNLETGETKLSNILVPNSSASPLQIIYTNGYLITRFNTNENVQKIVFCDINNLTAAPTYQFTVTSPYHTEGMNQYLGQLHCHYIPDLPAWNKIFNGEPNPAFTVNKYLEAGYDFVALTEHNQIVPMPVIDENSIMQIENAEESTQNFLRHHLLAIGVSDDINNDASDQERIGAINSQGGISIFAHPDSWVYGALTGTINKLIGIKYLEIYNNAVQNTMLQGYALNDFDKLEVLRNYKYLTAGDDYTPGDGFFDGAAVEVYATGNSQADIISSLKNGNFYALQGSAAPKINVNAEGNVFTINSSESSNITFIGKGGVKLAKLQNVDTANYFIQGDETYVRAEIESVNTGLKSWTQAVIVEPIYEISTLNGGSHDLYIKQAILYSNTSEPVQVKILNHTEYPEALPPLGYLSPVYQFSTNGEVLEGNKLAVSYANLNLPVSAENLVIYTYDETIRAWVKTDSEIDQENRIVTTYLPHYSLYTLSAQIPEDNEKPAISLAAPVDLSGLTGIADLSADAYDNQAVTSVRFVVDDQEIDSDIIASDGWTAQLDTSILTTGNHQLILEAEDFAGNISSAEYDIIVSGGITAPSVSIAAPAVGDYLHGTSDIAGNYISSLSVSEIGIYLDDVFIDKADINAGSMTFGKSIDWDQFVAGTHRLKLELRDERGNSAVAEEDINIGNIATAAIVSPIDGENYLRNQTIPLQISTVPDNAEVKIFVDGVETANNSSLDLLNYALGEHTVEVAFQDQTIAISHFAIITNYQDTIDLVRRLEDEGHFLNHGIPTAITAHLQSAQLAHILGLQKIEDLILQELLKFIEQQSGGNKQKIDQFAKQMLLENIWYLLRR